MPRHGAVGPSRAVLVAVAASAVAAAAVAPPVAPTPEAPPDASQEASLAAGCLAAAEPTIQAATGFTLGELRQARSLHASHQKRVDADNGTVFRGIALAAALGTNVSITDLVNTSEDRVEVCLFERVAELDAADVKAALALGAGAPPLGRARLLVTFHAWSFRNVTLDDHVALAAMALKGTGARVDLEDVLSVDEAASTERVFSSLVSITEREALLRLALGGPSGGAHPAPAPDRAEALGEVGREDRDEGVVEDGLDPP